MLFNSYDYVVLLALVALLRWLLPGRTRLWLLLLASGLFYASWSAGLGLVLVAATLVAFAGGHAIEAWPAHRKVIVAATVGLLVLNLAFFKYASFLLAQLQAIGLAVSAHRPKIPLPLGISFYTFTAIAYVVDVGRGEKAERDPLVHAVFMAFFPHLVAGPIVRKREISEQLRALPAARFEAARFSNGLLLVLLGLFQKMVLADGLSKQVESAFARPETLSSLGVALGVVAYAGQIFCDFSGYTHVGIGSAKLLGVDFPGNFDTPYLSASPAEFWRRWHMTLSRWLRDYLYPAVGGRRREPIFRYAAPLVTMTLAGLWHGAAWTFVAWGLYHGLLLVAHQAWVRITRRSARFDEVVRPSLPYRALATLLTFGLVCAGWVLFRASSFQQAAHVVGRIAAHAGGKPGRNATHTLWLLGVLVAGHVLAYRGWAMRLHDAAPGPVRALVWVGFLAGIYLLAAAPADFIYFVF